MNLCVLDTDHVSLFQRGDPYVAANALTIPPDLLAVTIITVEEQLRGRLNQIRKAGPGARLVQAYVRLHEALTYFGHIRVLDYDTEADARYQDMLRLRTRIGTQDLRIAAIVLSMDGATLVTRNQRDFGQIPDLLITDWSH